MHARVPRCRIAEESVPGGDLTMSDAGAPETAAVVLLVDDEPDLLELLEEFLAGQGYEVHLANGGDEGLRKIMEISPDAIVTDLVMPDVTGIEVLKTAR